ncbi:MAG: hypothetical protein LBD87_05000 [Prevotellaceae bacterium]|jgi:hypothetical protein|nr:hypothetical protein [Prevotellaceae bacterium]
MKTIFFFFAMAVSIAGIATQPEPPVYYTGNDDPIAIAVYDVLATMNGGQPAADTLQPATIAVPLPEQAGEADTNCPPYRTGKNEPAGSGRFIDRGENTMNNEQ